MNSTTETWLLPAQAANLLNVHPETVRRYAADGLIEFRRTAGRHRRYLESDIQRLIDDKYTGRVTVLKRASNEDYFSKETLFKFVSAMSTLLDAGMLGSEALPLAIQMSDDPELIKISDKLCAQVNHQYLSDILAADQRFPETVIKIFKLGEESGCLAELLKKLTNFYHEELLMCSTGISR